MNTTSAPPSSQAEATLKVLRQAVKKVLAQKKCLGQYSVIWRENRAVLVEAGASRSTVFSDSLSQISEMDQDEDFERKQD